MTGRTTSLQLRLSLRLATLFVLMFVAGMADWRRHLRAHRKEAMVGAAALGFLIGGGLAATGAMLFRRRSDPFA